MARILAAPTVANCKADRPHPSARVFNQPRCGLPARAVQVEDARLHGELAVEAGPVVDGVDPARGVAPQDAVSILHHAAARGAAGLRQSEGRGARRSAGSRRDALVARPDRPFAGTLAPRCALHGAHWLHVGARAHAWRAALVEDLSARAWDRRGGGDGGTGRRQLGCRNSGSLVHQRCSATGALEAAPPILQDSCAILLSIAVVGLKRGAPGLLRGCRREQRGAQGRPHQGRKGGAVLSRTIAFSSRCRGGDNGASFEPQANFKPTIVLTPQKRKGLFSVKKTGRLVTTCRGLRALAHQRAPEGRRR